MPKSPEELKEGAYHVSERILSDFKNGVTYSDAIERITDYWLNIIAQDRAERTGCCGKCYGTNAHNMNEHECINKSCPCHTPLTQRTAGSGVCLRKNMGKTDGSKIDGCMNCAGPCTCTHTPVDAGEWEKEFDGKFTEVSYECGQRDLFDFNDIKSFISTLISKARESTYKKTAQYVLDSVRLAVKAEREEILREVEGMKKIPHRTTIHPSLALNGNDIGFNTGLTAVKEFINKRK